LDADGAGTGFYFVTVGEGRRLAQLLRVKRKEIKKTEPIRCSVDTANDAFEISLDENVTRENMHPADQFEAFKKLAEERGLGAEDIAARFGVTPQVVRQRLRLGAVSRKLMQAFRDRELTLDQLMAFAITEDHARQEAVYGRLSYNRDAGTIRRLLTETHVAPQSGARCSLVWRPTRRRGARSCATSSPRIAAAISRMWRCLICW
jgi:ParB family transcriptional regulator, chromosome partitioning protein